MPNQITSDPAILNGKPYVKDTRLSVEFIPELFARGTTHTEIVRTYPQVTPKGLEEVLRR